MNNKTKKNANYEVPFIWIFLFWLTATGVAFYFGGAEVGGVVGVIAIISMFIQLINKSSSWEGKVVDLYTKEVKVQTGSGDDVSTSYQTVSIAKIRKINGKFKEISYNSGFDKIEIGDTIKKNRGKEHWQIIKAES